MAFSKGTVSTEALEIKRYVGVAPIYILDVNPNKAKLSELFGRDIENEPEYINKVTVGEDKHEVENVRFDFIAKTDKDKCNVDMITKVTFFIRNEFRFNRDKSKVQVIDKYGRTCWVTKEQAKNHEIPVYTNGPANIDKDYRPCYVGEEELTNFIKNYLCIPNVMKYVNSTWIMVDNPQECEARLENIPNYFKGDFKEIKSIISLQPENKVKVLFGVRTSDDNKQYQTVYTQMTLKNSVSDYSKLDADLQNRKAAGAYPTTEFKLNTGVEDAKNPIKDIVEYVNTPTNFTKPKPDNSDPFGSPDDSDSPWFN